MRFYLILLSIFLTLFSINGLAVSLNYGDFVSIILFVLFVKDALEGNNKSNFYIKQWGLYIGILFVSACINFTFLEGRFLNIFKTNLFSIAYFVTVYSYVLNNKISYKKYFLGVLVLGIVFIGKTWKEIQAAWALADKEFTNVDVFESSLNLNTWGYILVLFFILALYAWTKKVYTTIASIIAFILAVLIFYSFSRTAYVLTLISLLWLLIYINKVNIKRLIFPMVTIVLVVMLIQKLNLFSFQVSDVAMDFIEGKANNFEDDLIDTRFYVINIKPFVENYEIFNPLQMIIGDGVSVQHSILSHVLVVTGILGFIIYFRKIIITIKYCIKWAKNKVKHKDAKFLLLLIVVILANDFVTNVSSFLPFASYLASIMAALFFAEIDYVDKNEFRKEEKYSISNRV